MIIDKVASWLTSDAKLSIMTIWSGNQLYHGYIPTSSVQLVRMAAEQKFDMDLKIRNKVFNFKIHLIQNIKMINGQWVKGNWTFAPSDRGE